VVSLSLHRPRKSPVAQPTWMAKLPQLIFP
jgi:hypothetical protein